MASGHWEQRRRVVINPDTGARITQTYYVWVVDQAKATTTSTSKKPTNTDSSADKRARAAAKRRAQLAAEAARKSALAAAHRRAAILKARAEAAAKVAYAKKQAEARRAAYQTLAEHQSALLRRARLIGESTSNTLSKKPPVSSKVLADDSADQRQKAIKQANANASAVAAARARAVADGQKRAAQQEKERLLNTGSQVKAGTGGVPVLVKRTDGGVKTRKDAKDALQLLKNATNRDGSTNLTPDEVQALQQQYEKYASDVYKKQQAITAKLNALLDKAKNKKLSDKQRMAAWNRAKVLYYGDYTHNQKLFGDLFGDGTKQGDYVDFYNQTKKIAEQQREWWKAQMKASLNSQAQRLSEQAKHRPAGEGPQGQLDIIREQQGIIAGDPKYLGKTVDHYETEVVNGVKKVKPVYRDKTMEEALQDQQARIIMEQEKLRAQYQQSKQVSLLRDKHFIRDDERGDDPRQVLLRDATEVYGVNDKGELQIPDTKKPADAQRVANDLLRSWERKHPKPHGTVGGSTGLPVNVAAMTAWQRQRDEYEATIYKLLGTSVPSLLDRTMTLPGVSHLLSAFQTGTSSIGAAGRVTAKVVSGTSTIELAIPLELLPPGIREKAESDPMYHGIKGVNGVPLTTGLIGGGLVQGKGVINDSLTQWLATPEGQKWYRDHREELEKKAQEEDSAFAKGFYGGKDLGEQVDALNAYGSTPFSDDKTNLAFQLLVDPTNAIPLKFTTYLARGKYAAELAEGASKLNPKTYAKTAKNFLTVDEGVLKLQTQLGKFEKELAASGATAESAAEELRHTLAGLKTATAREEAFNAFAKKYGLDPTKINEGQVFNLSEFAATKYAKENGNLFTQQKQLAKDVAEREAAEKAAARLRLREQKAAQAKTREAAERDIAEGSVARRTLSTLKTEVEGSLKSKADAGAGQRAAVVQEPVGKAPAPTPRPPVSEPGPLVASLREVHARVETKVKKLANYKPYESFEQYYKDDGFGNMIPKDPAVLNTFTRTAEYRGLIKDAAKEGLDGDLARARLAHQATIMRNSFRTVAEDAPDVSRSRFTPTEFDVYERAGILTDKQAQDLLLRNRNTMRYLKRQASVGHADPHVLGFGQRMGEAIERGKVDIDSLGDDIDDINPALTTGIDIREARDTTFRGLHDIYEPFTENSLRYYDGLDAKSGPLGSVMFQVRNAKFVTNKMTDAQFMDVISHLGDSVIGDGLAGWRDGGLAVFAIFHHLRLAGKLDKLHEFSNAVDVFLEEGGIRSLDDLKVADQTQLFAWEWKVMEFRAGLPWAKSEAEVMAGFKSAATAWGLDADLAAASIPNGFRAQRPPLRFGLSPRLRSMADSDEFLPAPAGFSTKAAQQMVTDIFTRQIGEPMQVVHFVAKQFGDFRKGSPVMNRVRGELTHAITQQVGIPEMAKVLAEHVAPGSELARMIEMRQAALRAKYGFSESADVAALAARRGEQGYDAESIIRDILQTPQKKIGKNNKSFLRPNYPNINEAVESAYWAGDLPLKNPRAHELMYLIHMQNSGTRDAMVNQTRAYLKYMTDLGFKERGQKFIQSIHKVEFDNLAFRFGAEMKHGPMSKDALTGESIYTRNGAEWDMWQEAGFSDEMVTARLLARDEGVSKLAREAEEIAEEESKHAEWLRDERNKPSDSFTGMVGTEQLEDIAQRVSDAKHLGAMEGPVASLIKRISDTGGMLLSAGDAKVLDEIVATLREKDAGGLLVKLQNSIGEGVLAGRVAGSAEVVAWKEATLRLRLRVMETPSGAVRPQFTKLHSETQLELEGLLGTTRVERMDVTNPRKGAWGDPNASEKISVPRGKSHRINLDDLRKQYEASGTSSSPLPKDPAEVRIEPIAARPNPTLDGQSQLLHRLSGMNENQWYVFVKQKSRKTLRDPAASAAKKQAARENLRNIRLAEEVIRIEKQRGTFVSWQARANAKERVVLKHGKDAREYISPKNIAPYARDAAGASVEQVRTWVSSLRNAPDATVAGVGRLGARHAEDHFPIALFDKVEPEVAKAIEEARGWQADTLTRSRGAGEAKKIAEDADLRAARFKDTDPAVIAAKKKVLDRYGIDVRAYDEARKVLWKGYVQRRTNLWLMKRADKVVDAAKSLGVKNPDWDKAYLALRAEKAGDEAERQLGKLAYSEMYGQPPQAVFDEFVRRYSNDGNLRYTQHPMSQFQRRTLEEAVKARSGANAVDAPEMSHYLQSANRPPFEKGRDAVRQWLVKHGQWSPRKSQDFTLGKKSWSITDEAKYWRDNFGYVPDWTNEVLLAGDMNVIFHSDELYYAQMRAWGVLDRSMDLKLRLSGTDAKQIENARVHGDPVLGIPARRELEAQRRFAVERYGDLVGEVSGDGVKLTSMPWLMYPDEISEYLAKRGSMALPEGLVQNEEELAVVLGIIEEEMKPLMDDLLSEKGGGPILYEDIYKVAAQVQARVLADPLFANRGKGAFGSLLDAWTAFNRWMVFSNPAFLVMNVVDVPIKGAWYRATRRGLFNPGLHGVPADVAQRAKELTAAHLGLDAQTTMYNLKQRKAVDYARTYKKGLAGVLDRAQAPFRAIPETAGYVEMGAKMNLARGMYPQVYAAALKRLSDPELADAWAKTFIKDEIGRMWPTAGDGPFERMFNRFVPFASYTIRNKVLFLSEALANPSVLNKIDYIGRYIEEYNLAEWDKTHPGEQMPDWARRRIELPWAPGHFLDLSQFTDATRGLKPLYDMGKETTVLDYAASWVRVINPSAQAGIYTITNAMGLTKKTVYVPILDENGYPTGKYEKKEIGWTEPWSDQQPDAGSVFWFVDAAQSALEYSDQGFTAGEMTQLLGQTTMFNAIRTYDKGTALFTFWKALGEKDPDGAEAWLQNSPQGAYLKQWMAERASKPQAVMNTFNDMARAAKNEQYKDWFALSNADRTQITTARDQIKAIRDAYANRLLTMDRLSDEFRQTKAEMYWQINNVYLNNPALMKEEVWTLSAAEWSQRVQGWQQDKLMDDYMAMLDQRPSRGDFKSSAAYNKKLEEWKTAQGTFLQTYPQVQQGFATGITALDSVRDQQNRDWTAILDRVAGRTDAINKAKADIARFGRQSATGAEAQDQLDVLYLQNELDYNLLNKDSAATYFTREDFNALPGGREGPLNLKDGINIARTSLLDDFATTRMHKAMRDGTLDTFMAKEEYGRSMRAAILYAKGGDKFGEFDGAKFYAYMQKHPELNSQYFGNDPGKKTKFAESSAYISGISAAARYAKEGGKFDGARWVQYMKAHPKLLAQYFDRHPGKKAEWAATDAYIKHISVWGRLMQAQKWDEAERVWNNLPQWVKDRYKAKHGARGERAQQTSQYLGYMKRWIKFFDSGDEVGGQKYFNSLPQWAKDRYYDKHPDQRIRHETDSKMWSKLVNYFASDDHAQAEYLSQNPDLQRWLAKNGSATDATRMLVLETYRNIPKDEAWLRKVYREKYPEFFSAEAAGERKLKRVYSTLLKHPEVSDEFEKWVKAIWDTYAEMLKHGVRPLNSYIEPERKVPQRDFVKSLSAAQSSK